jgi:hypothetical protein
LAFFLVRFWAFLGKGKKISKTPRKCVYKKQGALRKKNAQGGGLVLFSEVFGNFSKSIFWCF